MGLGLGLYWGVGLLGLVQGLILPCSGVVAVYPGIETGIGLVRKIGIL